MWTICKYKRTASKDDKPFDNAEIKEFRTLDESEAHKVIKRWNNMGHTSAIVNIRWKYDFLSVRKATIEEMNDDIIPYRIETACM